MQAAWLVLLLWLHGLRGGVVVSEVVRMSRQRLHSMEWKTLSSSQLQEWYEPWEICMLKSNESIKYLNIKAISNCLKMQSNSAGSGATSNSSLIRKSFPGSGRFTCRLGHVYHKMPCVFGTKTYLPNMTHFLKAVEQFDDPRQLFLMDAFESLSEANSGLLFFGDSTINAFVSALLCELAREGFEKPDQRNDVLGIHGTNLYDVKLSNQRSGGNGGNGGNRTVTMVFKQYPQISSHHHEYIRSYISQFLGDLQLSGVVIVLQAGTWYHDLRKFRTDMTELFALLQSVARLFSERKRFATLVWAEQVAQHWPSVNGYYRSSKGIKLKPLCPIIANTTPEADWRNDFIWETFLQGAWGEEVAQLFPYVDVAVLNFRALTSDLSDMHMRQMKKDCTHYCYTPMLYQSIYHQISMVAKQLSSRVKEHHDGS